ncbi:MAG: anthranilate synthase component II [Myxococcota bacterium]
MARARILLVDHHDSFTFNLVQALETLGADVMVEPCDRVDPRRIERFRPERMLLGPGPGHPQSDGDVGLAPLLVRLWVARIPILGICLGHQLLARMYGATIVRAPRIMHGKTSRVHFDRHPLFLHLPSPFSAMRYHSWAVGQDSLPAQLEPLAWADDGCLMAFAHRKLPVFGVQFHPESIGTPDGPRLLANFLQTTGPRCRRSPDVIDRHR